MMAFTGASFLIQLCLLIFFLDFPNEGLDSGFVAPQNQQSLRVVLVIVHNEMADEL